MSIERCWGGWRYSNGEVKVFEASIALGIVFYHLLQQVAVVAKLFRHLPQGGVGYLAC